MKVTTTRAFRRSWLKTYSHADFDTFADYFLYLHLNSQVQLLHVIGFVVGLLLLPWALFVVFKGVFWPIVLVYAFYYGLGLVSHWLGDGRLVGRLGVWAPYLQVVLLNLRWLSRSLRPHEQAFQARYPHVMWVYRHDAERPEHVAEQAALEHRKTEPSPV